MTRMQCGWLLVMVFAGCASKPQANAERPPAKVVTVAVASQEITDYDEYVGRTEPSETVEVRARVTGYIKSIEFEDGQYIKADQPLFKIEPDIYEAAYQQSLSRIEVAKAEATLAQSKLKRAKSLIDVKAISPEEYEENESALTEAQAKRVAAEADARTTALDLKYTVVESPIAGRVDRALVTPGNIVTGGLGSGTLLTTIVKNDPIYVYFDVDERSALRYQRMTVANRQSNATTESSPELKSRSIRELNVPCFIKLMDESDFLHEGTLDFLQNRVDATTGSVKFRASFPNADRLLRGGMFVRVKVPVSSPYTAVLVPEQAIGVDQGQHFVVVVGDDQVAVRQLVQLGRTYGKWRIITQGINAGQQVVYKGLQRVRPGQRVQPELVMLPPATL